MGFIVLACSPASQAATFFVGDSTVQINNPRINPSGLSNGDTVNFTGTINVINADAVDFTPVPSGLIVIVDASASITSGSSEALDFDTGFNGTLTINGSLFSTSGEAVDIDGDMSGAIIIGSSGVLSAGDDGIEITNDLTGSIWNAGSISGKDSGIEILDDVLASGSITNTGSIFGGVDGIFINDDFLGMLINSGTISSDDDGFFIQNDLGGSVFNSGTISGLDNAINVRDNIEGSVTNTGMIVGSSGDGIFIFNNLITSASITNSGTISGGSDGIDLFNLRGTITNSGVIEGGARGIFVFGNTSGTIRNEGGRIQGNTASMALGGGNATVVLSGPSHIVGTINAGGGGNDVLRFENMRGISPAKQAELAELAAADNDGTIILFGESITWINFEDIQFDTNSVQSYSDLVTNSQLASFTDSLDNISGLNDDLRDFLKVLNDIDILLLEDTFRNSSGLSMWNALQDLQQNFDVSLFNQIMNQLGTVPFSSDSFSFSSLDSTDSVSMRQLKQNLIALDTQGTSDLPPLERTTIRPLSADDLVSNVYLTGYAETGHQSATSDRSKSSSIRGSVLLGSGSWLTENLYVGGFAGYTKSDARVDIFDSSLTTHSAHAGINASYRWNNWFANLMAGAGYHDIYTTRWNVANQQFNGETDGLQGMVMSQIGYHWINTEGTARLTPYVGMSYSTLHTDSYAETSATPGTALRFDNGAMDSIQTTLGFNATRHYETIFGFIRPQVSASWWHAMEESNTFAMSMATPGLLNSFTVESSNTNRDRAVYQLGMTVGLDELSDWVFYFAYQGSTGSEGYQSHGGTASARYDF